jgi:hypothetical protein
VSDCNLHPDTPPRIKKKLFNLNLTEQAQTARKLYKSLVQKDSVNLGTKQLELMEDSHNKYFRYRPQRISKQRAIFTSPSPVKPQMETARAPLRQSVGRPPLLQLVKETEVPDEVLVSL